jgi:hypothetical protein
MDQMNIPAQPLSPKQAQLVLGLVAETEVPAKLWAQMGAVFLSLKRIIDGVDIVRPAELADAATTKAREAAKAAEIP